MAQSRSFTQVWMRPKASGPISEASGLSCGYDFWELALDLALPASRLEELPHTVVPRHLVDGAGHLPGAEGPKRVFPALQHLRARRGQELEHVCPHEVIEAVQISRVELGDEHGGRRAQGRRAQQVLLRSRGRKSSGGGRVFPRGAIGEKSWGQELLEEERVLALRVVAFEHPRVEEHHQVGLLVGRQLTAEARVVRPVHARPRWLAPRRARGTGVGGAAVERFGGHALPVYVRWHSVRGQRGPNAAHVQLPSVREQGAQVDHQSDHPAHLNAAALGKHVAATHDVDVRHGAALAWSGGPGPGHLHGSGLLSFLLLAANAAALLAAVATSTSTTAVATVAATNSLVHVDPSAQNGVGDGGGVRQFVRLEAHEGRTQLVNLGHPGEEHEPKALGSQVLRICEDSRPHSEIVLPPFHRPALKLGERGVVDVANQPAQGVPRLLVRIRLLQRQARRLVHGLPVLLLLFRAAVVHHLARRALLQSHLLLLLLLRLCRPAAAAAA
mmetsp:Transcript_43234/g.80061  ORF Transcript_43234/g.80061 Transcript_43234/m.80061 type:complete len:500 (-) Transcript_43234:47-1546(-)